MKTEDNRYPAWLTADEVETILHVNLNYGLLDSVISKIRAASHAKGPSPKNRVYQMLKDHEANKMKPKWSPGAAGPTLPSGKKPPLGGP